jgi:hypothetical protein
MAMMMQKFKTPATGALNIRVKDIVEQNMSKQVLSFLILT